MRKIKYTTKIKERVVQLLIESEKDYSSKIIAIVPMISCTSETLGALYQKYLYE